MLKRYPKDKIPDSLKSYLNMCQKAKGVLEKNNCFCFERGAFFYHPDVGISTIEVILGDGSFFCTEQSYFNKKINENQCTWIPSKKQLKKLVKELDLKKNSFNDFLNDDQGSFGYSKGIKPRRLFKKPEEKWLAYYMLERFKRIWSKSKREWVKA